MLVAKKAWQKVLLLLLPFQKVNHLHLSVPCFGLINFALSSQMLLKSFDFFPSLNELSALEESSQIIIFGGQLVSPHFLAHTGWKFLRLTLR